MEALLQAIQAAADLAAQGRRTARAEGEIPDAQLHDYYHDVLLDLYNQALLARVEYDAAYAMGYEKATVECTEDIREMMDRYYE